MSSENTSVLLEVHTKPSYVKHETLKVTMSKIDMTVLLLIINN